MLHVVPTINERSCSIQRYHDNIANDIHVSKPFLDNLSLLFSLMYTEASKDEEKTAKIYIQ